MAELESALSQILGNPESMSKIMALAQSLGVSSGESPPLDSTPSEPPANATPLSGEGPPLPMLTPETLQQLQHMMQSFPRSDGREAAVLRALAPYLRPSRREKIEHALQIARLTHLAGYALRSFSNPSEENHV